MILSGLLSTMNVWVNKLDDIRFSINDAYDITYDRVYQELIVFCIGLLLILINIWCIRTHFLYEKLNSN